MPKTAEVARHIKRLSMGARHYLIIAMFILLVEGESKAHRLMVGDRKR